MQSLQVIANHHDDQGIRDHCLEVQVAASTYITLACIADSSWATSGSGAAAAAGGDGEGADGVDSATAGLEQLLSSLQAGNLDAVSEQLGKRAAKAGKKNTAGRVCMCVCVCACVRVCVPYGAVVCAVDFQSRGCRFTSKRL